MFLAMRMSIVGFIALLAACGQLAPRPATATLAPTPTAEATPAPTPTTVAGTQAATASLDVCALITPTEAATIMGIGNPLPMPQAIAGAVPGCTFQSDGAEELKLFVHRYPSLDEALKAQQVSVDRIKQQPSFQRITGIGDEAFAMGNSLAVRKQAVIITISLITTKTPAANLLRKQSLAQTLLERLP